LNSTFRVSYARERIIGGTNEKEFAVPMVSFSDLRLSELKQNIGTYGKFGIGLTKKWAIESGLNPVMYASQKSFFTANFLAGIESLFEIKKGTEDINGDFTTAYRNTINTLRYLKNYSGDLIRPKKKTIPNYVFANEREWRYVPPFNEDIQAFVPIKEITTSEQKSFYNNRIKNTRLQFQPDDIQYLVVEKDSNINELIQHLRLVKNRFKPETIDRLSSRILTYKQIENDI
jgi:hypothetical protein